jgi:hypothetical protein
MYLRIKKLYKTLANIKSNGKTKHKKTVKKTVKKTRGGNNESINNYIKNMKEPLSDNNYESLKKRKTISNPFYRAIVNAPRLNGQKLEDPEIFGAYRPFIRLDLTVNKKELLKITNELLYRVKDIDAEIKKNGGEPVWNDFLQDTDNFLWTTDHEDEKLKIIKKVFSSPNLRKLIKEHNEEMRHIKTRTRSSTKRNSRSRSRSSTRSSSRSSTRSSSRSSRK